MIYRKVIVGFVYYRFTNKLLILHVLLKGPEEEIALAYNIV